MLVGLSVVQEESGIVLLVLSLYGYGAASRLCRDSSVVKKQQLVSGGIRFLRFSFFVSGGRGSVDWDPVDWRFCVSTAFLCENLSSVLYA